MALSLKWPEQSGKYQHLPEGASIMHDIFEDCPDLMDIMDLRDLLEIGRNTAYKLCRDGDIPSKKIGGRWRITKKALREFVAADPRYIDA
ncbi:helix-turn-helix domain-containing protein [Ruminococcaceae bacterium OttesenSCG-928-D13]|nr:helix-turn-helix domain-containing protein [Ruminococcaceae bacterium OttesenSCG-928-D13]